MNVRKDDIIVKRIVESDKRLRKENTNIQTILLTIKLLP